MARRQKNFLTGFWQFTNIFNIMGWFGRYDHVSKKLIVFGRVETKVHSRRIFEKVFIYHIQIQLRELKIIVFCRFFRDARRNC